MTNEARITRLGSATARQANDQEAGSRDFVI